ncbi:MAG: hypothetical protein WBC91_08875 [Phototrophicaceae bacterium]
MMNNTVFEEETTIPHVTRHDSIKTGFYALIGLSIAGCLIAGTIWLFVAA